MIIEVEIDGRRCRVELERSGDGWLVNVDGRPVLVDAVQIGEGWSLLVGGAVPVPGTGREAAGQSAADESSAGPRARSASGGTLARASRRSYEVTVGGGRQGVVTVHLEGHAIDARVIDPRAFVRRGRDAIAAGTALRPITAPMPGRIVKVLVRPGDRVVRRQGLVVVEAMKMENELRAPADAVVREVRATEGTSVEAGSVLVVLE